MKLKTSLLFLLNQSCKILILACLISISGKAFSQSSANIPGLIESFQRLSELHKTQFDKNKIIAQSNLDKLQNFNQLTNIKIDNEYLKSIILNSDESALRYAQQDECRFLATLENKLLQSVDGPTDQLFISYQDKENNKTQNTVSLNNYLTYVYKTKCLKNRELSILYSDNNLKTTVSKLKFAIPKDEKSCQENHDYWLNSLDTAYLCGINQELKKGSARKITQLKESLSLDKRIYINNICSHLNNKKNYCAQYLRDDVWSKVIALAEPRYKMTYKCQEALNKAEVTEQDLKTCAAKFLTDDLFCVTIGNKNFPSYFPLQSCQLISKALNHSKLVTNYHDCPAYIDNEALTNLHRVINHFTPRDIISSRQQCAGEANYSLAKLNQDVKNDKVWPLQVCYLNRITNKKICVPYIPGSRAEVVNSEDKVIANILYTQKAANKNVTCSIVDSKSYNPLRSDYKFGCFIVFDTNNCTTLKCDKKVYWENKIMEDIEFIGISLFDYFPNSYINEKAAFTEMIANYSGIQSRIIRNLTDLKQYLKLSNNTIIHGIGCAEDLLPELFSRESINQCSPLPFIIDGHVDTKSFTQLVIRTAIDDLHTPRLIDWSNIFNAVSSYQELHPLNTWTLHGLKK